MCCAACCIGQMSCSVPDPIYIANNGTGAGTLRDAEVSLHRVQDGYGN